MVTQSPSRRAQYWFARSWDKEGEKWFEPTRLWQSRPNQLSMTPVPSSTDLERSRSSGSKNLPGSSATGDNLDGACTFAAAMHTQVEIDYQLSQLGRGLKYSSDPTLLLKDPTLPDGDLIRGAGNALIVSEKGDARLLEIGGTASAAVIEYVRTLRELALESIHGNRASPDKVAAGAVRPSARASESGAYLARG